METQALVTKKKSGLQGQERLQPRSEDSTGCEEEDESMAGHVEVQERPLPR